jgi:hypothetical protein
LLLLGWDTVVVAFAAQRPAATDTVVAPAGAAAITAIFGRMAARALTDAGTAEPQPREKQRKVHG